MLSCLFVVALWSPAGKGLTSWLSCMWYFVTIPNVPWVPTGLSPPVNSFTDHSKALLFVDLLCYLCLEFVMFLRLFIAALWSPVRKGLTTWLSFVMFNCVYVTFPCNTLGQVWYMIASFPDLCLLSHFYHPNPSSS